MIDILFLVPDYECNHSVLLAATTASSLSFLTSLQFNIQPSFDKLLIFRFIVFRRFYKLIRKDLRRSFYIFFCVGRNRFFFSNMKTHPVMMCVWLMERKAAGRKREQIDSKTTEKKLLQLPILQSGCIHDRVQETICLSL